MSWRIDCLGFFKLFFAVLATNGWWAFATWPSLGVEPGVVSPLIMAGIFPTLIFIGLVALDNE